MQARLKYLSPILWTKDLQPTTLFYENILGFKCQSNFPSFISLATDDVNIMFVLPIEEPEDCKDPNNKEEFFPKSKLTGCIFITTNKVDEIWERVKDIVKIGSSIAARTNNHGGTKTR